MVNSIREMLMSEIQQRISRKDRERLKIRKVRPKKKSGRSKSFCVRSTIGRERVEKYFSGDDPQPYLVIRTPIPHVPDWSGFPY